MPSPPVRSATTFPIKQFVQVNPDQATDAMNALIVDINANLNTLLTTIPSGSVLGNASGSSATPVGTTMSTMLDTFSTTQGALLFRGATTWKVLNPGTAGQVVASGGAGADLVYSAAGSGTVTGVLGGTTGMAFTASVTPTMSGTLVVANGGTGATTAAGARTALSAAASGVNNDITQITGLTTALTVGRGRRHGHAERRHLRVRVAGLLHLGRAPVQLACRFLHGTKIFSGEFQFSSSPIPRCSHTADHHAREHRSHGAR